jgi:hypothetical protein
VTAPEIVNVAVAVAVADNATAILSLAVCAAAALCLMLAIKQTIMASAIKHTNFGNVEALLTFLESWWLTWRDFPSLSFL